MRRRLNVFLGAASLLAVGLIASVSLRAETYTFSAVATGSLNGIQFTDKLMTFIATSDDTGEWANLPSAQFAIADIDSGTISDSVYIFANPIGCGEGCVGIGESYDTVDLADILDIANPVFANYSLGTPIGPIEADFIVTDIFLSFPTSAGDLVLTDLSNGDFIASDSTVTPEPSSLLLLGSGLVALGGAIRRKLV
jgi:PEP-CTERM motif